nr:hypothetical protein [Tanacetum cinerariifolium]
GRFFPKAAVVILVNFQRVTKEMYR